ncbi:gamma carbonic anhydrase family protein [Pararhodospirillum photometricum]|uniref:Transferase hexapeptide repeat n=1 Tax=Pararhodospirillum photometricum DSM 122 TaxID=1150469 RepID=H6SL96_PARPM|nr:gamma carbonic anhydrase family protein [Pararhodospirillum photometricum]CCG08761.1 Transferase hexapeptide repeat [Pararhodospirillum photometricum DSM 122]
MSPLPPPLILPFKGVWPRVADDVFLAPGAVIVGDVEIGAGSSVWFGCVLRGDVNAIRVGERVNLQDGTIVHVTSGGWPTTIGNDVTVGHRAILHACTLESDSFVGMGATVMDEVVVESWAMVAAGALVTPGKRVGGGTLWAGSPAKERRLLSQEEKDGFRTSAARYAELAQGYRAG